VVGTIPLAVPEVGGVEVLDDSNSRGVSLDSFEGSGAHESQKRPKTRVAVILLEQSVEVDVLFGEFFVGDLLSGDGILGVLEVQVSVFMEGDLFFGEEASISVEGEGLEVQQVFLGLSALSCLQVNVGLGRPLAVLAALPLDEGLDYLGVDPPGGFLQEAPGSPRWRCGFRLRSSGFSRDPVYHLEVPGVFIVDQLTSRELLLQVRELGEGIGGVEFAFTQWLGFELNLVHEGCEAVVLLKALALERRRHFRKGGEGWQIVDQKVVDLSLLGELAEDLLVVVQKTKWVFPEEVGLTAEHIFCGIFPRH